jgi:phage virion morphogenesis protein
MELQSRKIQLEIGGVKMAGAFIDIQIDDKQILDAFDRMEKRCGNLKPAMSIIGTLLVNSIHENFVSQGRPQKWQPLSEVTLHLLIGGNRGYKKNGQMRAPAARKIANKQILIGSGMAGGLMGSIHYNADKESVLVGTPKEDYGAIHQFGGMAGRGKKVKIPARPYIVVQDADMAEIKDTLLNHLASFKTA